MDSTVGEALLPRALRRAAAPVVAGCALVAAAIGVDVAGRPGPTGTDAFVDARVAAHLHDLAPLLERGLWLGSPHAVVLLSAGAASICLAVNARRAAVFVLAAPPFAAALTEWVLKPLVGRPRGSGLLYPSGHVTGSVAVAAALAVALRPGGVLATRLPRTALYALRGLAVVLAAVVPAGVISLRLHYATDVAGGVAVAVGVVLAVAAALDHRAADRPPALDRRAGD